MATYEVFGRRKFDDPLTHVGAVHAADAEAALLLARETHFRHDEGVDFAVVATERPPPARGPDAPRAARRRRATASSAGYSGFRDKRQAARDAADARGLGHVRDRPTPRSRSRRRDRSPVTDARPLPDLDHAAGAAAAGASPTTS